MKHLNMLRVCGVFIGCLFICTVVAEPITVAPQYQERYNSILNELRCLVCQNQTIAESDAELAKDLRVEVKKMLEEGATDSDIIDFMANRYGDFVLYKPLVKPTTYLLWFGPFVFLAVVSFILILIVKKQNKINSAQLSKEEQDQFNSILNKDKE